MGLRTKVRKLFWKIDDSNKKRCGYEIVHYLHIGKSGGSAFKFALRGLNEKKSRIILDNVVLYIHGHNTPMTQVPKGEKVIFFVRDPIKRFVSSFYERLRQSQPRVFFAWSEGERESFSHFKTADALASALSSTDKKLKALAENAMGEIYHVRHPLISWVKNIEYLRSRSNDIYYIGFQETLDQDFLKLKAKLKLPEEIHLPSRSDINANPTPEGFDKYLSSESEKNLRAWYAKDYELIAFAAAECANKKAH